MPKLKAEQVEEVRTVIANLDGLQSEITAAVKRKPNEPVTPFQLKIINGVLESANKLLSGPKPISGFETFDNDEIPVASDVAMVVAQYVEAFEKVRCENIERYDSGWVWVAADSIYTVPPRPRK